MTVSRRDLFALGGAAAIGAGVGFGASYAGEDEAERPEAVSFFGSHQSGVVTPPQSYLHLAAFDLSAPDRSALQELLVAWSGAAARLMAGHSTARRSDPDRPPDDPGEARGLPPARLTLTFGLGASLFELDGADRLGLRDRMPATLRPLPTFAGEALDTSSSDGDLCVQACADDAQVAFHAIHVLARVAAGLATPRWAHEGFRSPSDLHDGRRNLFGFKEGTGNLNAEDPGALDDHVWVRETGPASWMTGGTYLVTRRIRMLFDVWDTTTLQGQQRAIGRHKLTGAPLGRHSEREPLDLDHTTASGELAIPHNAHVRLAAAESNEGARLLRRSYSYSNGVEAGTGQADAGLIFICFQQNPHQQFARIQRRLATSDALNKHILHTASGVFACPPGTQPGGYVGERLLA